MYETESLPTNKWNKTHTNTHLKKTDIIQPADDGVFSFYLLVVSNFSKAILNWA